MVKIDEQFIKEKINPVVGFIFNTARQLGMDNAPDSMDMEYLRQGTEKVKALIEESAAEPPAVRGFALKAKRFREERGKAWEDFLELSAAAGYTIENNLANRSLFMGGYESGKEAVSDSRKAEWERERAAFRPWIPVEKRLPGKSGRYETTTSDEAVCYTGWISEQEKWVGAFNMVNPDVAIIAWRPLPEPYVEQEGKDDGEQHN